MSVSFSFRIVKSFAHANIEKTEIMKIAIPQIVIIQDNIDSFKYILNRLASPTIARKIKFTNQTWTYHAIKSLSSSVKSGSDFTLIFTNGAKNITHAIAESFASDEMMFLSVSIVKD